MLLNRFQSVAAATVSGFSCLIIASASFFHVTFVQEAQFHQSVFKYLIVSGAIHLFHAWCIWIQFEFINTPHAVISTLLDFSVPEDKPSLPPDSCTAIEKEKCNFEVEESKSQAERSQSKAVPSASVCQTLEMGKSCFINLFSVVSPSKDLVFGKLKSRMFQQSSL